MADLDLATILADGEYLRRVGDTLDGGPGGAGVDAEGAVDAAAAAFAAGTHTNVTVTYDDTAGSISLAASGGGGGVAGTVVLSEPFNNFTTNGWTGIAGSTTITTPGRLGGTCATCNGSGAQADWTIPTPVQSATVTVGFGWLSFLFAGPSLDIIHLRSDAGATDHTRLQVWPDGHFSISRGSTAIASSAAGLVAAGAWYFVELQVTLADSGAAAQVRLNGQPIIIATGLDTKNAGTKTVYDTLRISAMAGTYNRYDDLYLVSGAEFKGDVTGSVSTAALVAPVVTYTATSNTASLADRGAYVRFTGTNPTYTVPPNSSVAFPVGTQIDGVGTATAMTIIQGSGVTITKARTLVTVGAGSGWTLIKTGTDTWDLHGDLV